MSARDVAAAKREHGERAHGARAMSKRAHRVHANGNRAQAILAAALALYAAGLVGGGQALAEEPQPEGQKVYEKWCAPCHARGSDNPGTTALAALYKGSKPAALEDRTDLTPAIVKQFVRKGVSVMPFFRKTEISDAELDALATYLARPKR